MRKARHSVYFTEVKYRTSHCTRASADHWEQLTKHAVDEEIIFSLTPEALKEIIPEWGRRDKFYNKYVKYKEDSELKESSNLEIDKLSHSLRKSFTDLIGNNQLNNPEIPRPSTSADNNVFQIHSVPHKETLLGFLLLPLLLPTPSFKSKKPGDRCDPTKDFIQKSFILYAETDAEITNFMDEKSKFYAY
ncbi:hypothetical protein KQX54_005804 [Cotesia glomerata]|uniref:Uncharacterized protein n=1 Tax=Cotesia glomerata TaxID=32391 RepID=A0AAV7J0Y1_COTGL|nr:hypothetical protein KQX54_005804 [Cotesia glomerata]